MLASWFGMRAQMLERGIIRMLSDGDSGPSVMARLKSILSLFGYSSNKDKSLSAEFFKHPLIKYLSEDKWHSKPSYLTAQNFSAVTIDLLRGLNTDPGANTMQQIKERIFSDENAIPDLTGKGVVMLEDETKLYLRSMFINSNNDFEKFKTALEKWFDDTMQRASGWYKRHVQMLLFFIGFAVANGFNVNTIEIGKTLSKDQKAREGIVQMAVAFQHNNNAAFQKSKSDSAFAESVKDSLKSDLGKANSILGLGWSKQSFCICSWQSWKNYFRMLPGFILTALAISLGAPFWFDLLSKLVNLRGAGDNPDDKKQNSAAQAAKRVG